ncbi:hypothetical protein BC830DRAFT_1088582 [Chytriomyces sp. MP71]|nr:hypothetical protein BC830DRAFT_1088582 [Chytriomyces sp. MP71]
MSRAKWSVSMSRSNSVSSKAMNWFWGNRGSSSGNPVITPIHPNGKFNTFGLSLGGTSGGGLEMERTTSTATDSAPERQSMSYSITASDLEDGAIRERRLNFCSGPIDKRALSTRDPLELLVDIESLLVQRYNWTIQSNGASSGEFKLKVVKPRGIKIQEVNLVSSERVAMDIKSDVKREVASDPKMAQIYSGFPVSLKAKITKFMSSLAPSANKGFDGKESLASTTEALSGMEDEICFTVEIKKVKELASGTLMVDFRRLKGDVWGFKRLYSSVITELPL